MTRSANPERVARRASGHCGRRDCRCTHTEGCDHGWIELPSYTDPVTGQTYTPVGPCPVCRHELYTRQAEAIVKGSVNVR